ncbi:MAG TPA: beta-N-acetylhexosaminidase [Epulopiscium sp.]|nr:beta-N-acetylhexosaminidase [Candidatus Epulonipiscium sp.]
MNLNITKLSSKFKTAVELVAEQLELSISDDGIVLDVAVQGEGIEIIQKGNKVTITIGGEQYFIRALGLFVEKVNGRNADVHIKETPTYDTLELMLDCSRNGVINFSAFKDYTINLALMGYTTIQLYMEDTYEIKNRPYFGYLRGRYTSEQLKEMDAYANSLFIELVPAIQTLAHLGTALKWGEFEDVIDFADILLIGEEKTYALIEDMFKTLSQSIKSKNINIGMDEAYMVGLGKYLEKHGYQDRFKIMLSHLNKVMEIARKYGYKPMMWSDMFFRLGSGGGYHELDWEVSEDMVAAIPEDISLVYWDYYSQEKETYDRMIAKHKEMSENIIFAGGAWKWSGFTPANLFSHKIAKLAHASCMENNIKRVIITAWGDNGAECSAFAILPTLQLWAELCYNNNSEDNHLENRFKTCTSGDYQGFLKLDRPILTPNNPAPGKCGANPSKYILYQDILIGLFDKHIDKVSYTLHFQQCSRELDEIIKTQPSKWNYIFETQKALCDVLAIKTHVGINIRAAYKEDNQEKLETYANVFLPELIRAVETFIKVYKKQWMKENKSFGLDVFDIRIGGLLQRIKTAKLLIEQYLNNEISCIEELEEEILAYSSSYNEPGQFDLNVSLWHTIATPSNIESV